jgi:hypothetical protein
LTISHAFGWDSAFYLAILRVVQVTDDTMRVHKSVLVELLTDPNEKGGSRLLKTALTISHRRPDVTISHAFGWDGAFYLVILRVVQVTDDTMRVHKSDLAEILTYPSEKGESRLLKTVTGS